jgi:hypothetical protein
MRGHARRAPEPGACTEVARATGEAMFENAVVGIDGHGGGRDAVALAKQLGAPGAAITLARELVSPRTGGSEDYGPVAGPRALASLWP